ncbi:MAG: hypothetical protein U5K79_16020 [Cyclobacteriaceae bacterium]|nr:hypothetical protein [Cyclobacteriaceae bacterium]
MNRSGIFPFVFALILMSFTDIVQAQEKTERFILIEAPCQPTFPAPPSGKDKVIITKVFKVQYDSPFELVSAEPELITRFEVALQKAYPGSRNLVKDILVYMLVTEKEARELYNRKQKQFKLMEIAVIELKTE